MPEPLDLLTSINDFDELHLIADSRRATVKVDRQRLLNLLIDHTCLLNALPADRQPRAPAPQRRRETIIE
jgi:hypothetical protein